MEPNPKIRIPLSVSEQRQPVPLGLETRQQRVPLSVQSGGGGGGSKDYNALFNKPLLNGVTVEGDHDGEYYGLADRSWVETYVDEQTAAYTRFWFGTRAEYNALPSIDPAVCYCIEEGGNINADPQQRQRILSP